MYGCAQELRIVTERLVLRALMAEDAVWIANLANDVEVAHMTSGVPHPYRLSDAEAFVAQATQADPDHDRSLLIEHAGFGPIGMTGFHRNALWPELGYWLGGTFRGRGFATEAVQAAVDWAQAGLARGGWGKRAVVASHFVDNPASARVLDKVGFLYTGERRQNFSVGRGQKAPARAMVRLI